MVITCLPSPAASAEVMGSRDGILAGMAPGKIWAEMSTTDAKEVGRLGGLVAERGGEPVDSPVSGGCHRAATGNSFVHETESQVILNGSRDINFTMDLVLKDVSLFQDIAAQHGVPLEISPILKQVFLEGQERYGAREWSPNIIRRLEDACGFEILAPGFPAEMVDEEPETPGEEVAPRGRR